MRTDLRVMAAVRHLALALFVAIAGLVALAQPSFAVIEIDINKGKVEPMPVAIPVLLAIRSSALTLRV